ncbi:MAG: hypothetical protein IJ492_00580 [Clostridia bacterium]|nr:hypothetical protein [Clostridia bacterium]MBQ8872397.1 hypothetical protein [Clostridia bacterium]MBQ9706781.1 hypothetical protein [Clostridia bacterium]
MAYINIFISKPLSLHVKDQQLVVGETTFPLQDINCLMLDNYSTTIKVVSGKPKPQEKPAKTIQMSFFMDE